MTVAAKHRAPERRRAAARQGGDLAKRVAAVEARLERFKGQQDEQFLRMMKFTILRHMSLLGFAIEHGGAPKEAKALAKKWLDEGAQSVAEAPSMEALKEADVEVQRKVRQLMAGVNKG